MFQTTNHTPWLCSRNHWCNSSTIPWWYTMIWSTQNMMIHPPWIGASKCSNSATASPLSLPSLGSCLAGIVQQLVTNEVNVTWDLRSNKPNQQYLLQSSNWTPSDLWGLWTARHILVWGIEFFNPSNANLPLHPVTWVKSPSLKLALHKLEPVAKVLAWTKGISAPSPITSTCGLGAKAERRRHSFLMFRSWQKNLNPQKLGRIFNACGCIGILKDLKSSLWLFNSSPWKITMLLIGKPR